MALQCNGETLPFNLVISHNFGGEKKFKNIFPYKAYTIQNDYIDISEGLNTAIKFYVDDPIHFDENAKIEVQTSLYDSSDARENLKYPLSLGPNINWIYQHSSNEVFPWRMGIYYIQIYYKGKVYTTGFRVKPLHLTLNQVQSVHNFLENKIEGIIYDLMYSKESLKDHDGKILTNWYYDYARYISSQKEAIIYFLRSIEKKPITQLISENRIKLFQGRMNRKSIQWSNTSRGISKNGGIGGEIYFYNQIKKVDYNHKANQWMKNLLSSWSSDLHVVIEEISKNQSNMQKNLKLLRVTLKELESRKSYLSKMSEVSTTTKIDVYAQIQISKEKIQRHSEIIIRQETWIIKLRSVFSRIILLLNSPAFREIERGRIKPQLKDPNYFNLNLIYENSKLHQNRESNTTQYVKVLKPFWQLYEYYCLFSVMDILKNMGFSSNNEFQPDFIDMYHQNLIPSETLFEVENERAVIHCWYDKYHGDKFSAEEKGELFFAGQEKKRPDIKLDLYEKKENGELLFISTIILDAKFRKLSNMHNNDYATKTYQQLTSYYNFFYLGANRKNRRGQVVQQVICLYGSEKGKQIKKTVEPLLYIQFFPRFEDNGDIKTQGEHELKEELGYWLEDYI